ncbi:MAG: hypothetical protein ACYDAQ_03705 [Mycobacteriales bacterium]
MGALDPTTQWRAIARWQAAGKEHVATSVVLPRTLSAPMQASVRSLTDLWRSPDALTYLNLRLALLTKQGFTSTEIMPDGRIDAAMLVAVVQPNNAGGIIAGIIDSIISTIDIIGCADEPETCPDLGTVAGTLNSIGEILIGIQPTVEDAALCNVSVSPYFDSSDFFLANITVVSCPRYDPHLYVDSTLSGGSPAQYASASSSCNNCNSWSTDAYIQHSGPDELYSLQGAFTDQAGTPRSGSDSAIYETPV